jgi:tetratricopeptide (TPR) repeat protein
VEDSESLPPRNLIRLLRDASRLEAAGDRLRKKGAVAAAIDKHQEALDAFEHIVELGVALARMQRGLGGEGPSEFAGTIIGMHMGYYAKRPHEVDKDLAAAVGADIRVGIALSELHVEQHAPRQALESIHRILNSSRSVRGLADDRVRLTTESLLLSQSGRLFDMLDRPEGAVGAYEQARTAAQEAGDPRAERVALLALADVHERLGRAEQAAKCRDAAQRLPAM